MNPWRIEFSQEARKFLHKLRDEKLKQRISDAIDGLAREPRPQGSVKLSGLDDAWRIRVGDYRIIYEVREDRLVVLVINIGHRREIYR